MLNGLVNLLKAVSDPFIRSQVRDILIDTLRVMFCVQYTTLNMNETFHMGPIIFSGMFSVLNALLHGAPLFSINGRFVLFYTVVAF